MPRAAKSATQPKPIFQFNIVLQATDPPIWRRIQVPDVTFDELHECIQAAMGWSGWHLHQFVIDRKYCGQPEIMDGWGQEFIDSTQTLLSELIGPRRRSLRFRYDYDFGDDWRHDIVFEGMQPVVPGAKYPRCLDGEGACPPEDIGGAYQYEVMLNALSDRKHEEYAYFKEIAGRGFDPDKFSAPAATKAMQRGIANFRP